MRNFSECVRKYSPATGHMWKPKRQKILFPMYVRTWVSRGNDHIINSALNYGYAIIRGMIARSIICYGLEPSIGIFHHSELNNYNLADDMIEPFRPLVDLYVSSHFDISEIDSTLTPEMKRDCLEL